MEPARRERRTAGAPLPLRLRHPRAGELRLFSTISVLGAPLDVTVDEVAIEAVFPADDATAAFLRSSRGWSLP